MLSALLTLSAGLAAFISGAHAAPIAKRDVFDPTIISPNADTVWIVGSQVNVTWDTSDAPEDISNGSLVTLDEGGLIFTSGPGSVEDPLAEGFDLRAGWVTVTVPDVTPGDDYQITLFGDSGNISPSFTIAAACESVDVEIEKRDVWSPTILSPNADTVWIVGQAVNVTWDTSDAPEDITNGSLVTLDVNDIIVASGPGSIDDPLAEGFDLRQGWVTVTVPAVAAGSDYKITLFGDASNFSPAFVIAAASSKL